MSGKAKGITLKSHNRAAPGRCNCYTTGQRHPAHLVNTGRVWRSSLTPLPPNPTRNHIHLSLPSPRWVLWHPLFGSPKILVSLISRVGFLCLDLGCKEGWEGKFPLSWHGPKRWRILQTQFLI